MAMELRKAVIARATILVFSLTILLLILLVVSLSIGSSIISIKDVFSCVFLQECDRVTLNIVRYRIARSTTSFLVGALLALSGTFIQAVARNPLAEPYILGLSSTALSAIAITILVYPGVIVSRISLMIVSFCGAFAGYVLTTLLSTLAGGSSLSLILSGIAVTTMFSGISYMLLYVAQTKLAGLHFRPDLMLLGSTASAQIIDAQILFTILAIGIIVMYVYDLPRKLNAYVFGDSLAKQLGYNPRSLSTITALIVSILTGACVSVVGIVGFIGLVAPHIARLIAGTSDHRITVIISLLVGSILSAAADIAAKMMSIYMPYGEFPLGIVTSIIGAPFFSISDNKRW
uniref:Iron ABC transporter permease n=1 Tax=Ignisphaera aggregans TaxID=334771 RepID=A0A7C2ZLX4_9CREN